MLTKTYKRYVLGTLTLVLTMNWLDRGLVMLLLQPIKEDLHLTDTQLGFLTGIAPLAFFTPPWECPSHAGRTAAIGRRSPPSPLDCGG